MAFISPVILDSPFVSIGNKLILLEPLQRFAYWYVYKKVLGMFSGGAKRTKGAFTKGSAHNKIIWFFGSFLNSVFTIYF